MKHSQTFCAAIAVLCLPGVVTAQYFAPQNWQQRAQWSQQATAPYTQRFNNTQYFNTQIGRAFSPPSRLYSAPYSARSQFRYRRIAPQPFSRSYTPGPVLQTAPGSFHTQSPQPSWFTPQLAIETVPQQFGPPTAPAPLPDPSFNSQQVPGVVRTPATVPLAPSRRVPDPSRGEMRKLPQINRSIVPPADLESITGRPHDRSVVETPEPVPAEPTTEHVPVEQPQVIATEEPKPAAAADSVFEDKGWTGVVEPKEDRSAITTVVPEAKIDDAEPIQADAALEVPAPATHEWQAQEEEQVEWDQFSDPQDAAVGVAQDQVDQVPLTESADVEIHQSVVEPIEPTQEPASTVVEYPELEMSDTLPLEPQVTDQLQLSVPSQSPVSTDDSLIGSHELQIDAAPIEPTFADENSALTAPAAMSGSGAHDHDQAAIAAPAAAQNTGSAMGHQHAATGSRKAGGWSWWWLPLLLVPLVGYALWRWLAGGKAKQNAGADWQVNAAPTAAASAATGAMTGAATAMPKVAAATLPKPEPTTIAGVDVATAAQAVGSVDTVQTAGAQTAGLAMPAVGGTVAAAAGLAAAANVQKSEAPAANIDAAAMKASGIAPIATPQITTGKPAAAKSIELPKSAPSKPAVAKTTVVGGTVAAAAAGLVAATNSQKSEANAADADAGATKISGIAPVATSQVPTSKPAAAKSTELPKSAPSKSAVAKTTVVGGTVAAAAAGLVAATNSQKSEADAAATKTYGTASIATPQSTTGKSATATAVTLAGTQKAGGSATEADDLTKIHGIGPATAKLLNAAGIRTYQQLHATKLSRLQNILADGGSRFALIDASSWHHQTRFATTGDWDGLTRWISENSPEETAQNESQQLVKDQPVAQLQPQSQSGTSASAGSDDLTRINGIGPATARLLHGAGITTFAQLQSTKPGALKRILHDAGSKFTLIDHSTWSHQASFAARNRWADLTQWLADREETSTEKSTGTSQPASQATGTAHDLTMVSGIGPATKKLLNARGIFRFEQVAALTNDQITALFADAGQHMVPVKPETWAAQAAALVGSKSDDLQDPAAMTQLNEIMEQVSEEVDGVKLP